MGKALALGCLVLALAGCAVRVRQVPREPAAPRHAATLELHTEQEWLPSEKPSDQPTRGRAVYAAHCASCHGAEGRPAPGTGAADFSAPQWGRTSTPLELVRMLATGRAGAATHARFDDRLTLQEMYDVVAHVSLLSTSVEAIRQSERTLFGTHCNVCHGNKGFGNGFLAPTMQPKPRNLADFHHWGIHRSDQEIHDNIAKGLHWSAMPPWHAVLKDEEIWSLVDFVRSLQYVLPGEDEPAPAATQGGA